MKTETETVQYSPPYLIDHKLIQSGCDNYFAINETLQKADAILCMRDKYINKRSVIYTIYTEKFQKIFLKFSGF